MRAKTGTGDGGSASPCARGRAALASSTPRTRPHAPTPMASEPAAHQRLAKIASHLPRTRLGGAAGAAMTPHPYLRSPLRPCAAEPAMEPFAVPSPGVVHADLIPPKSTPCSLYLPVVSSPFESSHTGLQRNSPSHHVARRRHTHSLEAFSRVPKASRRRKGCREGPGTRRRHVRGTLTTGNHLLAATATRFGEAPAFVFLAPVLTRLLAPRTEQR